MSHTITISKSTILSTLPIVISFTVPFLLGHNQILTGSIVNAALIISAVKNKQWDIFPIIMLPSLAVMLRGIMFGSFTPALLYMMPFIWAGNYLVIALFQKIERRFGFFITVGITAMMKASVLFLIACALLQYQIVPKVFLTAMGVLQFGTMISGGVIAWVAIRYLYDNNAK